MRHFLVFFRCSFRPEVVSDVIFGILVDPAGLKVPVKFGDSRSYRSRDIRLPHYVTNDNDNDAGYYNRAQRLTAFRLVGLIVRFIFISYNQP